MATHTLQASTFQASHIDDEDIAAAPAAPALRRPSFFRRLHDAILESQMRRAQREIDRILGPGALKHASRTELPPDR
jgi:hypothetical protein